MPTAELTITATLSSAPETRGAQLQQLHHLVDLTLQNARSSGGADTSGEVKAAHGAGTATWAFTPAASS